MRLRPMLIFFAAAAGVFALGVVLFNYLLMPLFIHQYGTVVVPELVGMSEKQAERFLNDHSLVMKIQRREFSNEDPDGYVISQSPRPGDTVKEGRTINIIVSLGTRTQSVPEMAGLSLRQGRILLKRKHLRLGRVAKRILEGNEREEIISSTPGAGREVAEGGRVDVLISVGGKKRRFLMPELTGQDLLFVREKLEKMGFRMAGVRYEFRSGVYPNTIIDQIPKAGAQIGAGDSIELVAATTD